MTYLTGTPLCVPLFPRACDDVVRATTTLACALGLQFSPTPERMIPALAEAGTVLLQQQRLLLAGTRTNAPLLQPEALALANALDLDILLLRKVSFDKYRLAIFASLGHGHTRRPYEDLAFQPDRTAAEGGTFVPRRCDEPVWWLNRSGLMSITRPSHRADA